MSCSATGRPAPTVTLTVLQQDLHFSHYSSVSVTNTDGTVTVNATAVLSGFHGSSTQVGCAVRVLSGPQVEVFLTIPEVKQSPADGEKHLLQIYRMMNTLELMSFFYFSGFYEKYRFENVCNLTGRRSQVNNIICSVVFWIVVLVLIGSACVCVLVLILIIQEHKNR